MNVSIKPLEANAECVDDDALRNRAAWCLFEAQDARHARLARMLHDNVSQSLVALQLGLRGLEREIHESDTRLTLDSLEAIAQSIGEELHKLASELRPASLSDHGLSFALTSFLQEWSLVSLTRVETDFVELGPDRLPERMESLLFSTIRELLETGAVQQHADRLNIVLHRRGDDVVCIIEEHGGCQPGPIENGSPPPFATINQRLLLLGGEVAVEHSADRGRSIIIRLPVL